MPTADDFTLANAQAADYAKFASALNYIQGVFQSSGTVATVQGSTVRINHQGIDAYDATGVLNSISCSS